MFKKVLVANRGEIAVRLIRGLREMGVASVAVYSDADRAALHVRMADEAAHIGPAASAESYLSIEKILDAARRHEAEAIHPGYGFLSENAEFAAACEAAGFVFIGPPAAAIRAVGSKTAGRRLAQSVGAPVTPGSDTAVANAEEALRIVKVLGYPVLLKAVAGGGGKGMRRVDCEAQLESAWRDATSEAERAFGSGEVYVEKLVLRPRHIEIQVLGDRYGHLIHLGERECSLQRRHQKVVEECPSPLIAEHPEMRAAMGDAAVRIAKAAGYVNAGTLEFLVDGGRNFYFLEMNTRLQVEHPVTELVTGIDLVHWQLRIAAGERLTLRQSDIAWRGSAVECRIYAEDPDTGFLPSPGKIAALKEPAGPGVRLDSGVYAGWVVPLDYDPLLAKLAVWAQTRESAIERARRALAEYSVNGIRTNLTFFREILDDAEFRAGRLHTAFIEEFFERRPAAAAPDDGVRAEAALVAALEAAGRRREPSDAPRPGSRWTAAGRGALLQ
ncbi:MAG: acetyl-CoA carboxylase biotin carboxylase subunit [Bryobacteraceae bacterium]